MCINQGHECARVAHCVTARWRNFSHYCCPLRQYDVRFTCSDNREALTAVPTAHSVQKQAFRVHHWTSREGSLRHSSGWGTEAFPRSSVICAPVTKAENYMPSCVLLCGFWLRVRTACRCKNIDLRICSDVIYCKSENAENHSRMKPTLNWFMRQRNKVMNQHF